MKESKLPEVQENTSDQVTFGFSFEYDWLRRWYEFFLIINITWKPNSAVI